MTDWAARLLNFRRGELRLALLSALFYFCVLSGYFFLRPVRDAMGVARGMDELRWLFVVTTFSSLALVLMFGGAVSRMDRRKFIPVGYGFVVVCLLGFATLLFTDAQSGGGLIGTDAETGVARGVGYTFYAWLSAINLFINSLFLGLHGGHIQRGPGQAHVRLYRHRRHPGRAGQRLGHQLHQRVDGVRSTCRWG